MRYTPRPRDAVRLIESLGQSNTVCFAFPRLPTPKLAINLRHWSAYIHSLHR